MGTVPSGGDYEYDLAHEVPEQARPAKRPRQADCAPPVHGEPDLGTDYGYDEVHRG
jgi:hypothetical protein